MTVLARSLARPAAPPLDIEPFGPVLGATVHGLDLRAALDEPVRRALRRAVVDHGVLFLRDQALDPAQLLDFARLFGEPLRHNPYLPAAPQNDGVESIEVSATRTVRNDAWHADVTWIDSPPRFTVLQAEQLPPAGGDTVWTSSAAAYESLPPLLAQFLETLTAINSFEANGFGIGTEDAGRRAEIRSRHPPIEVPIVKTHPESGRKAIFVSEQHTMYVKDVTRTTSESLLRLLFGVLEQPEHQVRFRWTAGAIAVWDNRLVQHRAIRDYGRTRRVLHRVTIA